MQAAIKTCKTKVDAKAADIVKKMEAAPFNVKKDQCNVKFDSFIVCLKTEAFGVRSQMKVFKLQYNFFFFLRTAPRASGVKMLRALLANLGWPIAERISTRSKRCIRQKPNFQTLTGLLLTSL